MSEINRRSLLIGIGATATTAATATAIAPSAFAYMDYDSSALSWARGRGVINSTGTSYLNRFVSRGEFVYMLVKASGADVSKNWWVPFNDVPVGHPYRQHIAWAYSNGYVNGYKNNNFGVNNIITRAEACTVIYRAVGRPSRSSLPKFIDIPFGSTYYDSVQWVTDKTSLSCYDDGKFRPRNGLYRRDLANVFYNVYYSRWIGEGQRWIPTSYDRPFTAAGLTSTYHIYADNINKNLPVGVLYFFEGDYNAYTYKYSRIGNPNGYLKQLAAEAAKKNMILVAPRSPNRAGGGGNTWWDSPYRSSDAETTRNGAWFRELARFLTRSFKLDTNNVWLMGYSGGAEFIGFQLAVGGHDGWLTKGGAIPVGGGTHHSWLNYTLTNQQKSNFKLVYTVGALDGYGATAPSNWSALNAATRAEAFYRSKGYRTNLHVIPNQNHGGYNFISAFNRAYNL